MADISIIFMNDSSTTFQLGTAKTDNNSIMAGLNSWNTYPDNTMLPGGSEQSISMSAMLSEVVGRYEMLCTWINPKTDIAFGVKIHVPPQLIDIGTAPYWYVFSGNNNNQEWQPSGADPAMSYTWPTSVGFKIYGSPTASHDKLFVNVTIKDLPSSLPK